jgi:ArsR family transcriptional regulator, arsenate/arsenite/antimonite-responsive transcriptional repressor
MTAPLASLTRLAKAMAHPARLRILAMLADGELCVCQLTAVLKLAPSTVSAHLGELKRAGLVLEEKRAKFVFYALSHDPEARRWHRQAIGALGDDPSVAADGDLVGRIRGVPVEEFVASGSDLSLLPVHPATGTTKTGATSPRRTRRKSP